MNQPEIYENFRQLGLEYGPTLQGVKRLWANENEAVSAIDISSVNEDSAFNSELPPALWDSVLQTTMALLPSELRGQIFVPFSLSRLDIRGKVQSACYAYVHDLRIVATQWTATCNITVLDETGRVLAELFDFSAKAYRCPSAAPGSKFNRLPQRESVEDTPLESLLKKVAEGSVSAEEADRELAKLH